MTECLFGYHAARQKGVRGEREVRRMLEDAGLDPQWNGYETQRFGRCGADLTTKTHAIEVKRYASGGFLAAWWHQAQKAAQDLGKTPAVVYRFDRRPWMIRTLLRTHTGTAVPADLLFSTWLAAIQADA